MARRKTTIEISPVATKRSQLAGGRSHNREMSKNQRRSRFAHLTIAPAGPSGETLYLFDVRSHVPVQGRQYDAFFKCNAGEVAEGRAPHRSVDLRPTPVVGETNDAVAVGLSAGLARDDRVVERREVSATSEGVALSLIHI